MTPTFPGISAGRPIDDGPPPPITIVLNWAAALTR